jgi:anthranilate phosphoribosyltransferase
MALLGTRRTLVVSGEDGLGDVTLAGTTYVTEVSDGSIREFSWRPEDFGIAQQSLAGLAIDGPSASSAIIQRILKGEPGAGRDIVVLNAAAGLVVAEKAADPKVAANMAMDAINNGRAAKMLERLAAKSHEPV